MKAPLLFLSFFLPFSLYAGGFQVNLQGQKNTGMGHTGTGINLGASGAFFNPGAYSFSNNEISVGANFISAYVTYRELSPGIYSANSIQGIGTPFSVYSSFRIKKESKVNFGLAVYTPFGSSIQYEDDWKGQFLMREMALQTIFIQPTIGYQVTDKLGIGAGFVYAKGDFSLRKGIPAQNYQGEYGEASLSGQGEGIGFNAGIFYQAADNISMGISYRSGVRVDLNQGMARFEVPESIRDNFPETKFTSSIRLPSVLNIGLGFDVTEKTMICMDLNYVAWSSYDTLSFDFETNTETLEDVNSPRRFKNVLITRLGLQYKLNESVTTRAGFYYDFTPVQDGYMTPESPDMDKLGFTVGASYFLGKRLEADFSLLYIFGPQREDRNLETDFAGIWKSRAIVPGIGLTYKF